MSKQESYAKTEQNVFEEFMDWLESLVLSLFIVLLVFTFLIRQVSVEGSSMLPTLVGHDEGQSVTADRLIITHLREKPKYGDIVVIKSEKLNENIIKRVIATENQTVDINFETGDVIVNGKKLVEPYIKETTAKNDEAFTYPVKVPPGHVFVMGDNRNNSTDSRSPYVGFVDVNDIVGKAFFRIYPFETIGSIYK